MGSMLVALALEPEIQEKLRDEVNQYVPEAEKLDFEQLKKLD